MLLLLAFDAKIAAAKLVGFLQSLLNAALAVRFATSPRFVRFGIGAFSADILR
jgi:hypothetical protein